MAGSISGGSAPGQPGGSGSGQPGGHAPGQAGGQPPAQPPGRTSRDELVRFGQRFYDALNRRDYRTLQTMMDDQFLCPAFFGSTPVSPQAVTRCFSMIQTAFPDWTETLDRVIAVEGEWVTLQATGRGTHVRTYRGRSATGQQIASPLLHSFRVVNGKMKEYRGVVPFDNPLDTAITAPFDVWSARAEQGGSILTADQVQERQRMLDAFRAGALSPTELSAGLAATAEPARCQALLEQNHRRCKNAVEAGRIYCGIHADVDPVHNV